RQVRRPAPRARPRRSPAAADRARARSRRGGRTATEGAARGRRPRRRTHRDRPRSTPARRAPRRGASRDRLALLRTPRAARSRRPASQRDLTATIAAANMTGDRHTVLVVDDDESLRMLCRVNLELEGYRVLEAATVETAKELLRDEPIDVVLLDVHVGAGNGFSLLSDIGAQRVALFSGSFEAD